MVAVLAGQWAEKKVDPTVDSKEATKVVLLVCWWAVRKQSMEIKILKFD